MYEELVKRLRYCATDNGCKDCPSGRSMTTIRDCIEVTMTEAADAIEERCQQVDKFMDEAARLYAKLPRWISVEERLPKANEYDSRGYAVPYLVMNGWMRVTARRKDDCWVLFGNGTVLEYVTHWMPLPEPPKEET